MSNETLTTLVISLANKSCKGRFSRAQCYLTNHGQSLVHLLVAFALLPQILHLYQTRHRYVAGVSYLWIIIRIFALMLLVIAHSFKWLSLLELMGLLMSLIIFAQIIVFSNNLHRQNKIIFVVISGIIWIGGILLVSFFVKEKRVFINIIQILFAVQMIPQVLLNSLLRTAKALSKISVFLLLLSDSIFFYSLPNSPTSNLYLITSYYSFSFLLHICFQYLIHNDAHIHSISRSTHTVLTPGVDIFTGLDANGKRSSGADPQMFSVEDADQMDDEDVIYQTVTTNKSSEPSTRRKCLWYAPAGLIFALETLMTIVLIYRVASLWILFVPLSIVFILTIFYLIRTHFTPRQMEFLRQIL